MSPSWALLVSLPRTPDFLATIHPVIDRMVREWHDLTVDGVDANELVYRTGTPLGNGGWVKRASEESWRTLQESIGEYPRGEGGWHVTSAGWGPPQASQTSPWVPIRIDLDLEHQNALQLTCHFPSELGLDGLRELVVTCLEGVDVLYAEIGPTGTALSTLGGSTPHEERLDPENLGAYVGSSRQRLRGLGWLTFANDAVASRVDTHQFWKADPAANGLWLQATGEAGDFTLIRDRLEGSCEAVLALP